MNLLSERWVVLLGWTLLHFLWQGTLIAFAFAAARAILSRSLPPEARYLMACAALGAMTVAPLLTCLALMRFGSAAASPVVWQAIPAQDWQRVLPWLVTAWFGGVVVFSGRLIGGWRLASRIRSSAVRPAPPEWQRTLDGLVRKMGAWRPVRLAISSLVEVPTVVGWLRPAILMPVGALTGLPPEHVAALLAHELAHIRRHDYLANILQSAAEAVLFYHPAVWWVSGQIRAERELCCDDLAIAVCGGDVLVYARALADVESFRPAHAQAVLAANGGSLSSRIRRLIGDPVSVSQSLPSPGAAWSLALLWLAGVGAVTMLGSAQPAPATTPSVALPVPAVPALALRTTVTRGTPPPPKSRVLAAVLYDPFFEPPQKLALPPDPEPLPVLMAGNNIDTEIRRTAQEVTLAASVAEPVAAAATPPVPLEQAVAPESARPSAESSPRQPASVLFHSGTRLVEVEVVVRDKKNPGPAPFFTSSVFGAPGSPVKGLSKDDFTLLDNGKPQPISVFRAGPSSDAADDKPMVRPPGAVSNRLDSRGQTLNGATVVLIDQLNTVFDLTGYERLGMSRLLRSLKGTDSRIAVYSLGEKLHLLQDFGDDPQRLIGAAAKLESGNGSVGVGLADAFRDFGDIAAFDVEPDGELILNDAGQAVHAAMTLNALKLIIQHLSAVPGRKNLVWLMPSLVSPAVAAMAQQANVALYPVLVRAVGESGVLSAGFARGGRLALFGELEAEHAAQGLASATGGEAFFDAMDLPVALQAAEEDSRSTYVLGYYPREETLDGQYHNITVKLPHGKLNGARLDKKALDISYRPGYFATTLAINDELFENPVDLTGVGLTAQLQPDPARPGLRQLRVTVDLHDVRLERKDNRLTGAFDMALLFGATQPARALTVRVDFHADQLATALEKGFAVNVGGLDLRSGELGVVVQDKTTGAAGSVKLPLDGK